MQGKSRSKGFAGLSFLLVLALLLPRGSLLGAPAEGKGEDSVIDNVQKNYDAIIDFVADFRQEREVKALKRTIKARGKLYFKRPGKMLWSYDEPKGEWVLADGKNFYYYQPEQRQVLKSALKSAFRSDIPLSFLLGIGDLKKDFRVTLKGPEKENYVLDLAPKGGVEGADEILLGVDRQAFGILWARIRDAAGNVTTVHFSNIKKAVGLKDSLFRPNIPEGVEVMELGSP